MVWDDLGRDAKEDNKRDRDKWIGVYIGILAVLLAVCTTGGDNAAKDAARANLDATNTWAFFQAKNMRRHVIRMQVDEFELMLAANPGMPDAAKMQIQAKLKQYRDQDAVLSSDPKQNEGLDELFKKAKSLEADRDLALKRDPYFDYGSALLQIAIVLASISIISGGSLLLVMSLLLGATGALMTFNGFTLMLALPFLG
jgi:hypothetical protein